MDNDKDEKTNDLNNDCASTEVGKWIASIRFPEIRVILNEWCKYQETFHELYVKYHETSKAQFETKVKEKQNGNALSDAQNGAIVKLYALLHKYQKELRQQQQLELQRLQLQRLQQQSKLNGT